jgi:hypothetical protein
MASIRSGWIAFVPMKEKGSQNESPGKVSRESWPECQEELVGAFLIEYPASHQQVPKRRNILPEYIGNNKYFCNFQSLCMSHTGCLNSTHCFSFYVCLASHVSKSSVSLAGVWCKATGQHPYSLEWKGTVGLLLSNLLAPASF